MAIIIGLGSNLNRPLVQLRTACKKLIAEGLHINAYSNIYQTEPLLPEGAPASWTDKPYLNAAVKITTHLTPQQLLKKLKKIEVEMGRVSTERWAPRVIDLDILIFDELQINEPQLHIPHLELSKRIFALKPLLDIFPEYQHPQVNTAEFIKANPIKMLPHLLGGPVMMGVLNVTPDSFSDGGKYFAADSAVAQAQKLFNEGADIIDIGAESTRPGAILLNDPEKEWQRLEPVLSALKQLWSKELRPMISVDTRHAIIAEKALKFNIDWINDVEGGNFEKMLPLIKAQPVKYVAMHHLGVPRRDDRVISGDPIKALLEFQHTWLERFAQAGLSKDQLILDVGIGFGKTVMQQLAIINRFHELKNSEISWLIGHSRKSFLQGLALNLDELSKDVATAMISAQLAEQHADYLRVHAPLANLTAIRLSKQLSST